MVSLLRRFVFLPSTVSFVDIISRRCLIEQRAPVCSSLPLSSVHAKEAAPRTTTTQTQAANNPPMDECDTGYLDADAAAALDAELMSTPGFTLEQLMELAGLSVAEAVAIVAPDAPNPAAKTVLLVCGPGNNGGDGLVAARHLKLFGFQPTVVYPKRSSRQPHYTNLVQQCQDLSIDILDAMPETSSQNDYSVVVDAIFGFSFKGEPREPFASILKQMHTRQDEGRSLIVAVDVPSGWNVNEGDVLDSGFLPDVLVSLTAPKLSARNYPKRHFVGGRFLPPALAEKYGVRMPPYPGVAQVMEINRGGGSVGKNWEQGYANYLAEKETQECDEVTQNKNQGWEEEYAAYLVEKEKSMNGKL